MSGLRTAMSRLLLMFALVCCALPVVVCAQSRQRDLALYDPHHVDGSSEGTILELSPSWLAKAVDRQEGNDARFADPRLDDSGWKVIQAGRRLQEYGFAQPDFIWYRVHVKIPAGRTKMALLMRDFGGSYAVYVNGREIGNSGAEPSGGSAVARTDDIFSISDALLQSGDVVIAVRGRVGRRESAGTGQSGFASYTQLSIGPKALLREASTLYLFRNYTSNTVNILFGLLVPLLALALALTLPKEREYMWLVIASCSVFSSMLGMWGGLHNQSESVPLGILNGILWAVSTIAMLEFVRIVLGLPRTRWWAGYEWFAGGIMGLTLPLINYMVFLGSGGLQVSFLPRAQVFVQLGMVPYSLGLPVLAFLVWRRRRNIDALLLFVPLFLQAVVTYLQLAVYLLNRFHVIDHPLARVPIETFYLQWREVTSFLFTLALLLFLVLRTVRIARSRAAMASDLHAVQSVQEILLARASHATPGYRVEHVYFPAQEVGGDFFLVSPGPDGSLTAILGDVSGKGLVAAMRVSMILGVLRREEDRDPGTILSNLNDALLMQGEMGFTTACCVRLEPNGRYTIANAGHISPYIGGEEVLTPSALPLGMVGSQTYDHVMGFLPAGRALVLMSDGVVEARSPKGELYGFDRLPQLTLMAAEDIADVARRFGQEDDITVLTVACEG